MKYNLKDICLIPRVVSSVRSREDVDTSIKMGNIDLKVPVIASPMKDVCDGDFGSKLIDLGCFGIVHRFCSIDEQAQEVKKNKNLGAAIGTNGDCQERFIELCKAGCRTYCIDVANGASEIVRGAINKFLAIDQYVKFIVGNVASKENFLWLAKRKNVVGIRVGISGGNACTTKNATGIYHPMASLIQECKCAKNYDMPLIIADGGITGPSDICKAIALGADCVMLGSVLAAASDSPAELIKRDGVFYKVYHGSASFEIQKNYRERPRYIEGKTSLLDYNNESLEQIITKISDGLQSSMSYFDAKTISEFQEKVSWCVEE